MRIFWLALILCLPAYGAGDTRSASQTAQDLERKAARLEAPLADQFRMLGAQTLQSLHPETARKFVDATLEQLRSGKDAKVSPTVVRALAEVAPEDAVATLKGVNPGTIQMLIGALAQSHPEAGFALYRSALAEGKVKVRAATPLIVQFAKTNPPVAAQLFEEVVAAFSFNDLEPSDAWWLITTANSAAVAAPEAVADLYQQILQTASSPKYGENAKTTVSATFQIGSATVATDNSRDTLLVAAGGRLRALAPERVEKFKAVLSRWNLNGPLTIRNLRVGNAGAPVATPVSASTSTSQAIVKNLGQFRGLPTDADRAKLALATAEQIRSLAGGPEKLGLAQSLCNVATEGDLGKEALTAVAGALADAVRQGQPDSSAWIELAKLIRYERLPAPFADPALETADTLLSLREVLAQESGFTLTALDGKKYSLDGLRGRVVLLNFWATWCPPCRKEMPDMETLYRRFGEKGLVVLAVSDEERDTVTGFLQKQNYTFPVLLDPGRKVNTAFAVEGIPKSFLFDREGKLVAEAIDMRTERQFLEMLKTAGLE